MLALFAVVLLIASVSVSAYDQKKILVDLTHAERVSIDGVTSPNLDTSTNGRILNWTDWAEFIREQGYAVDVLTEGPINAEKLEGCNILIVAEPDNTTGGPAYFTTEESAAIGSFVENGGGLLLMGTQLVGGASFGEFVGDYDTVYHFPEIHNALLANLGVGMRFAGGMIGPDPYDVLVEDDIVDQVGGPKGNVWIHEGDKMHPIWENVPDGKFAYWHGCSINVTDESIDIVATGDDNTYTSVKNTDYSPVVKPSGSYPVAIASAEYGTGKIVAYGDAGCWQGNTPFGDLFTKTYYNEQEIASNLIAYLCEPLCVPDLVITEKSEEWVSLADKTYNVTYTVKNNGTAEAGASTTCIYINGFNAENDPVGELDAGANYTNTVGPFTMSNSSDIILICADKENAVSESNETNNCLENVFIKPESAIFDTGKPENPYPSIYGIHNGTIIPDQRIVVNKMFTYSCPGTGGHSEYIKLWNATGWSVSAMWTGYAGDWHNVSFDEPFTLEAGKAYNYTIRTGSYPQIHHTDELDADCGTIKCQEFIDANGKVYNNWIPAIKLYF